MKLSFTLTVLLLAIGVSARGVPEDWTNNINDLDRRAIRPTTITKIITVTRPPITVTKTVTGTCSSPCESPTAVATYVGQIVPPVAPTATPDYAKGLTFGNGWGHIACETYCSSNCAEGLPFCDPSCSNKGTCGNSNRTNLYLGGLIDPLNPGYTIIPTPPARSFTIFQLFVTAGITDFLPQYPHLNFEVRAWDRLGSPLATKIFIIPKPPNKAYHSDIRIDLVFEGFGDVSKLEFLVWHEGSIGSGGQGPDGRVLGAVKIDGDGLGGGIRYEVYTPLC